MRKHSPYNVHEVIVRDPPDPRFTDSARDEIEGLLKRGSYVVVGKDEIPPDATVLKSRVRNSIKTKPDGSENFKTRLVIQGHKEPGKNQIVKEAPTVLRSSVRLILILCAVFEFKLWSRDVKQALIQSDYPLQRSLYIKPPQKPDLMSMISKPPEMYLGTPTSSNWVRYKQH